MGSPEKGPFSPTDSEVERVSSAFFFSPTPGTQQKDAPVRFEVLAILLCPVKNLGGRVTVAQKKQPF